MSEADESYLHHLRGLFHSTEEDFHERIYDFFPGIIYVYNTDTRKLRYVNKKITDVLGFSYDDIKTWDNDFSKIIFKEDQDLVQRELAKFDGLKDEDSHSYRCRFNRKEGDWMHFNVIGKVLRRDETGKAASLLLVAQDINDQIRSNEEVKAVRELAEDNEELLQFGNWNYVPATGALKWSRGMYILMDYSPDIQEPAIKLDDYLTYVVEQDRTTITDAISRAGKNHDSTVEFKYTVVTQKKNEKIFYSKGKVIYDDLGEVQNIVGITRDITDSTRLYDNLHNYRTMVMEKEDFLNHGSWEADVIKGTEVWSDGMFRLFGYDPKTQPSTEVTKDFFSKHLDPVAYEKGMNEIQDRYATGDTYVWGYEITTPSGELKMLEAFGKMLRDRNGKPVKIIGTTRDITQLNKYEHELEEKISELDRSNKELEDFAYAASHDLQEPLRKIATLTDRLQTKFGEALAEEGKKVIDRIQLSIRSGRALIDSLMEFSRITQDDQSFEKTDLNKVVADAESELEMKIEETKATLTFQNLPTLEIAATQLRQLFFNLILNSLKFAREDVAPVISIRSRIVNRNEYGTYHLNTAATYYLISVEDNGIGFEPEYEQKIFQMFHRLHGKSEYPGSGIGLALCKKIVEHHKGVIFARGVLDKGATFSFILPEKHLS